ncbi:Rho GTPase activation protein [Spinellus fusiger]|nr:Rho GTPase activation protein [Spinellus fusiger]
MGRQMIALYACQLPDPSVHDYDLILSDAWVESDYSLVFFASPAYYRPSWMWLLKVYRALDRRYKKNLKALHVVHLAGAFRYVFDFANRLMSPKFAEKLFYYSHLEELDLHVPLSRLAIPPAVVDYELSLPWSPSPAMSATGGATELSMAFGRTLEDLAEIDGKTDSSDYIPCVLFSIIEHLRKEGLEQEGLFRKSPSRLDYNKVKRALNKRLPIQLREYDIHISCTLLKSFINDLPCPLITTQALDEKDTLQQLRELIHHQSSYTQNVLHYLITFLAQVADHSSVNKMTVENLAIVFAPNLIRSDSNVCVGQGLNESDALGKAALYLKELKKSIECVKLLILHRQLIFAPSTV